MFATSFSRSVVLAVLGIAAVFLTPPPPPSITSVTKTGLVRGQSSVTFSIKGSSFVSPVSVAIDGNVTVTSATVTPSSGGTQIDVTVSTVNATVGTRTITVTNPDNQSAAAALLSVQSVAPNDYDGDFIADLAFYRPGVPEWKVRTSSSGFTTAVTRTIGAAGLTAVPGDFDGDGRIDYGIYVETSGAWQIFVSSNNFTTPINLTWGGEGAKPAVGDYDGDRKTDVAVYRANTAQWQILKSSTNNTASTTITWAGAGYKPVSGLDFDGDGKADAGAYSAVTGGWYILLSGANYTTSLIQTLSGAGGQLVPGDYDGDGKADFAVYNFSSNMWSVRRSSLGYGLWFPAPLWGGAGHVPAPLDIDGDGKLDLGTYDPATLTWAFLRSTGNYATSTSVGFGQATDSAPLPPVPYPLGTDYRLQIDGPAPGSSANQPTAVWGWTVAYPAASGTGVDQVRVRAYQGASFNTLISTFVGAPTVNRSDIAGIYGPAYLSSGFNIPVSGLPAGVTRLAVSAHVVATDTWTPDETTTVTLGGNAIAVIETPSGQSQPFPFTVSGYALDLAANAGSAHPTGIDEVQIWAAPRPGYGTGQVMLGMATYGGYRAAVGSQYGIQFSNSGFTYTINSGALAPGAYDIAALVHSTVSNTYIVSGLLTVYLQAALPVVIAPGTGEFQNSLTVSMSTGTSGAQIYYRLDGGTPTTSSTPYTGPFSITTTSQVRAIATKPGWLSSPVASADYTQRLVPPTISLASGSYAPGTQITVTSTPAVGPTINYTVNGVDPTTSDPAVPSGGSLPVGNFTLKVRASMANALPSAVASATYTLAPDAIASISGGAITAAGIRSDGSAWGWGTNGFGSVGDGTTTERRNPVAIGSGVVAVSMGSEFGLALMANGTVRGWGRNNVGQVGDGTTTDRWAPTQVSALTDFVAVEAGYGFSAALRGSGQVLTWGENSVGQLGDGTTTGRLSPAAVPGLSGVKAIAAANAHMLALKTNGTVWAWGQNTFGQLGDGTTTQRLSPVQVSGLSSVVAIAAGRNVSFAIKSDGTVAAWGMNTNGQLGDGTLTSRSTPVTMSGVTGAVAVTAGRAHSLVLKSNGTVLAAGDNALGQLGTTPANPAVPTQIPGLSGISRIAAGDWVSYAVASNGAAWAWGDNTTALIGDGTLTQRNTPVAISGANLNWRPWTPVISLASGAYAAVAPVITNADGSAVMRYTLSGADPVDNVDAVIATGSTLTLLEAATLKVRSFKAGAPPSEVASATYTLTGNPVAVIQTPSSPNVALPFTISGFAVDTAASAASAHPTGVDEVRIWAYPSPSGSAVFLGSAAYGTYSAIALSQYGAQFQNSAFALTVNPGTLTPGQYSIAVYPHGTRTNTYPLAASVTVTVDQTVATPVITAGGSQHPLPVTITTATSGAQIYYTLNGSAPSPFSTPYTGPLSLTTATQVRAMAAKSGMVNSAVASASYDVVATPAISPGSGSYGEPQTVSISTGTGGAQIYYTLDGSTPSPSSTAYTGALSIVESTHVRAMAAKSGWIGSATADADINLAVAAPVLSVGTGDYEMPLQVTMTTSTPGAEIHYRLDGGNPAASSPLYTGPLSITGTSQLRAIAVKAWWDDSPIVVATYTQRAAAPVFDKPSGTYAAGTLLEITTTTPGARITYTVDGSEPTHEDATIASGDSITLGSFTLKARTWLTGLAPSTVTSTTYAVLGSGATLYEHVGYEGLSFSADVDTCSAPTDWYDRISSVSVPANLLVKLYTNTDCTGTSLTLRANNADLRDVEGPAADNTWNDVVRSVQVTEKPADPPQPPNPPTNDPPSPRIPEPPPNNTNTCRGDTTRLSFLGTLEPDGMRHIKVGVGEISGVMDQAARDAITMINGFSSTTKIILDPVIDSSGATNIRMSSDDNQTKRVAALDPLTNQIWLDTDLLPYVAGHPTGMERIVGHELLHFLGLGHNTGATQASLMQPCEGVEPNEAPQACLVQAENHGGMQLKDAEMIPYCVEVSELPSSGDSSTEEYWEGDDSTGNNCYTRFTIELLYDCRDGCVLVSEKIYVYDHYCSPLLNLNAQLARLANPPLFTPVDVGHTPVNLPYTPANPAVVLAQSACAPSERSLSVSQTCGRQ